MGRDYKRYKKNKLKFLLAKGLNIIDMYKDVMMDIMENILIGIGKISIGDLVVYLMLNEIDPGDSNDVDFSSFFSKRDINNIINIINFYLYKD